MDLFNLPPLPPHANANAAKNNSSTPPSLSLSASAASAPSSSSVSLSSLPLSTPAPPALSSNGFTPMAAPLTVSQTQPLAQLSHTPTTQMSVPPPPAALRLTSGTSISSIPRPLSTASHGANMFQSELSSPMLRRQSTFSANSLSRSVSLPPSPYRGLFGKEVSELMFAFGDVRQPNVDSAAFVHDVALAFLTDTVHAAVGAFAPVCMMPTRTKDALPLIYPEWMLFAVRKHPHRLARAKRIYQQVEAARHHSLANPTATTTANATSEITSSVAAAVPSATASLAMPMQPLDSSQPSAVSADIPVALSLTAKLYDGSSSSTDDENDHASKKIKLSS